jgi:hypothetical protein
MASFEDQMNRLTDLDAGWWPFLSLRPARHERMDNRRLLKIAYHFGTLYGLLMYLWYLFIGFLPLSFAWALVCVAVAMVFFFVAYKYSFAIFWNRRAGRLQQEAAAPPP